MWSSLNYYKAHLTTEETNSTQASEGSPPYPL